MKKIFLVTTLTFILFLSACGDVDETPDQVEEKVVTEQNIESDTQSEDNNQIEEDETESSTEESQDAANQENIPSDDKIATLESKYNERANDGFIESIEPKNDEYTELIVHVSDKFDHINENGYKSKLEGIGKSIREMTSGVLYDKAEGTLPLIEFRDNNDNIIAKFESHSRDERMVYGN